MKFLSSRRCQIAFKIEVELLDLTETFRALHVTLGGKTLLLGCN